MKCGRVSEVRCLKCEAIRTLQDSPMDCTAASVTPLSGVRLRTAVTHDALLASGVQNRASIRGQPAHELGIALELSCGDAPPPASLRTTQHVHRLFHTFVLPSLRGYTSPCIACGPLPPRLAWDFNFKASRIKQNHGLQSTVVLPGSITMDDELVGGLGAAMPTAATRERDSCSSWKAAAEPSTTAALQGGKSARFKNQDYTALGAATCGHLSVHAIMHIKTAEWKVHHITFLLMMARHGLRHSLMDIWCQTAIALRARLAADPGCCDAVARALFPDVERVRVAVAPAGSCPAPPVAIAYVLKASPEAGRQEQGATSSGMREGGSAASGAGDTSGSEGGTAAGHRGLDVASTATLAAVTATLAVCPPASRSELDSAAISALSAAAVAAAATRDVCATGDVNGVRLLVGLVTPGIGAVHAPAHKSACAHEYSGAVVPNGGLNSEWAEQRFASVSSRAATYRSCARSTFLASWEAHFAEHNQTAVARLPSRLLQRFVTFANARSEKDAAFRAAAAAHASASGCPLPTRAIVQQMLHDRVVDAAPGGGANASAQLSRAREAEALGRAKAQHDAVARVVACAESILPREPVIVTGAHTATANALIAHAVALSADAQEGMLRRPRTLAAAQTTMRTLAMRVATLEGRNGAAHLPPAIDDIIVSRFDQLRAVVQRAQMLRNTLCENAGGMAGSCCGTEAIECPTVRTFAIQRPCHPAAPRHLTPQPAHALLRRCAWHER